MNAMRMSIPSAFIALMASSVSLPAQVADHTGFQDLGGALIGESPNTPFAIQHYTKGKLHILVLEDLSAGPNSPKEMASLQIRIQDKKQFLSFGLAACKVNGKIAPFVIGLTRSTGAEYCPAIRAWRVDPQKKSFTPIPIKQVECEDPGFGI